jgi:hypothetical protein
MPESFTCQVSMTGSTTSIECEPDPNTPGPELTCKPPESEDLLSKSSNPAVASLVSRFSGSTRAEPARPPNARETPAVTDLALSCIGQIDAVAIVLIGATKAHPLLGVLGGAKAGLDLAKCIADERYEAQARAAHQRAIDECQTNGGTAFGVVNDQLICGIPAEGAR